MSESRLRWNGNELIARMDRAAGRAVIAIGENVTADTKRVTHVISGTLRRSVHTAPPGYGGFDDLERAKLQDLENVSDWRATLRPGGAVVEVGSFLPYACVEWVGRGHPGVTQGLEVNRGPRTDAIVRVAVAAEGLA